LVESIDRLDVVSGNSGLGVAPGDGRICQRDVAGLVTADRRRAGADGDDPAYVSARYGQGRMAAVAAGGGTGSF